MTDQESNPVLQGPYVCRGSGLTLQKRKDLMFGHWKTSRPTSSVLVTFETEAALKYSAAK